MLFGYLLKVGLVDKIIVLGRSGTTNHGKHRPKSQELGVQQH